MMSVTTVGVVSSRPDPEVRVERRSYSPAFKLRVLAEIDAVTERGRVGEILRREGLYSSLIAEWRKQRDRGALQAMTGRRSGPRAKDPVVAENSRLRDRVAELEGQLETATELIDAQGKVSALLSEMSRQSAKPR